MLKMITLITIASLSTLTAARADDSLARLATMTSPCTAAALNAAAKYAHANSAGDASYQFSSFGPTQLTDKAIKAGANESLWIGFQNSAGAQINLKVSLYCQQGGFESVVSIERQ